MSTDSSTHLHWEAESLWLSLLPVLPHLSVEVLARCESTNSTLIERARQVSGDPDAPVTAPGALDPRALDARALDPRALDPRAAEPNAPEPRRPGGRDAPPRGRRGGDVEPCLLVAEQQTRGRGRLGREWVAAAGSSLTFSLALPLAPRDWSGLSLAVGLALAEALDPVEPSSAASSLAPSSATPSTPSSAPGPAPVPAQTPRLLLKWPNDLWLRSETLPAGGAKLGGVLVETVSVGARRMCIVGIGLNVLPLPAPLAGMLGSHACVQMLDAQAQAPAVLARIALPLVRALQTFESEGFAPLVERYALRDLLRGEPVTTVQGTTAGQSAGPSGTAAGVDAHGALLLRRDDGQVQRIVSGEVSVRRAPPQAAGGPDTPDASTRAGAV